MKSTDGKSQREERGRKEKSRREKEKESEERRYRRAKCQESRKTLRFSNDLWAGGWKSRLAKAAGAEPFGQMRNEELHSIVA